MWHVWRFRPRPLWRPWQWPWGYYAWRLETYTGIPASAVTWRTFLAFLQQRHYRRALRRYLHWVGLMQRLRRF